MQYNDLALQEDVCCISSLIIAYDICLLQSQKDSNLALALKKKYFWTFSSSLLVNSELSGLINPCSSPPPRVYTKPLKFREEVTLRADVGVIVSASLSLFELGPGEF